MDVEAAKALETIIKKQCEFEAISILLKSLKSELEESDRLCCTYRATLKAIKKINDDKNKGISYLLED